MASVVPARAPRARAGTRARAAPCTCLADTQLSVLSFDVRPVADAEVTRSFVRGAAIDAAGTVVGRVAGPD